MGYFTELRDNWRPLLSAALGLGSGFSFTVYTTSIMAPHLIAEFGWSRAEFAAVGGLALFAVFAFPVIGRLADVMGVRRTAAIGVVSLPITFTMLSMMNGDLRIYMAMFVLQSFVCILTTTTVYSRIVVQYITKARGLALAIVASAPAVMGTIFHPQLNDFVEANGWRAGYLALAVFTGVIGAIALLIMPAERKTERPANTRPHSIKKDYPAIFRTPAFWILGSAMLLCNLPQVLATTQLTLLLQENGMPTAQAGPALAAFSIGMLVGRFACGLALDRFPAHIVATIGMIGPSIGLFLLASGLDNHAVLIFAVLLFGLSLGAEGDLVGYLVVRNFGVGIYSSVLGLMTFLISTSSSTGAALVGFLLLTTGNYTLFLIISGCAVFIGSLLLLLLRSPSREVQQAGVAPAPAERASGG